MGAAREDPTKFFPKSSRTPALRFGVRACVSAAAGARWQGGQWVTGVLCVFVASWRWSWRHVSQPAGPLFTHSLLTVCKQLC